MPSPNKTRRTPQQQRSRATVHAILEATAQLLVTEGYDRASTNRIARRAGVSVGSLYQYFPDKRALVEALAERHLQHLLAVLTRGLAGAQALPIEALTARVVHALIAAHQAEPELHRVLAEQSPVDVVHLLRGAAVGVLAEDMEVRRGENRVQDAELSAFLVVTLIDEAIRSAIQHRPHLVEEGRLERGLTEMVTRYVLPVR